MFEWNLEVEYISIFIYKFESLRVKINKLKEKDNVFVREIVLIVGKLFYLSLYLGLFVK